MARLDATHIGLARLANQRLWGPPFASPAEAVGALAAVQAQDYGAAKWAVAQRTRGCSDADLDRALADASILRTHVLRPTWHFVLPADIRWMLRLTAGRVRQRMKPYDLGLGLDATIYRRANAVVARALRGGGALTREELALRLEKAGIPAKGQRLAHLLINAELSEVICSGALRGRRFTYALLDERAPPAPDLSRDEALAGLARRFMACHGPATTRDLANWSGLTAGDAARAVASAGLESASVDGRTYWLGAAAREIRGRPPRVLLLPSYDEYLIGYRDREPPDPAVLRTVPRPGFLLAGAIVLLDGRPAGGWRRTLRKGAVDIEATLARPLDAAALRALEAEAARYARFVGKGVAVALRVARPR